MATTEATPRINALYLQQFQGQTVRLLGKVTQLRGETASVDAHGSVEVLLNRDVHLQIGHAVEIVGKVMNDLKVKVLVSTDLGTNIDFAAADAVVDATLRYKEIFYASAD